MKKLMTATILAATLALAACGGSQPDNYGNVIDDGTVIADNGVVLDDNATVVVDES
jgi:protein involved in sex pheromone biosynthesis